MCGIAGIVNFNRDVVEPESIIRMIETIKHRGPDDEGSYVDNNGLGKGQSDSSPSVRSFISAGLGHKRLSIIDLSKDGRQPLSNEDESIWLVCNGEIYNYKELRSVVERKGHRLKSRTDSEVIIHLYEEYGDDFVTHLNGMFAFGLWDSRERKLVIVRDRLGIKPLYYYYKNGKFIFASEIKAILTDNDVKREIDFSALHQYFSFFNIPAPQTIFKNIFKVMPGTILQLQNNQLKENQYWDLKVEEYVGSRRKSNTTEEYCVNMIYELLEESVKSRMISDVPIGAFLSGGVDSSAIVGIMSKLSSKPIKTFCVGFGDDEKHYDELKYARTVAKMFHTDHREFVVKSDIVDLLPTVVRHFDEPFANPTAILMYLLSKETKKHVSVALSGTGGDEVFAGYTRYKGMKFAEYAQILPQPLRQALRYMANKIPESSNGKHIGRRVRQFINGTFLSPEDRYMTWVSVFNDELKDELFSDTPSSNKWAKNQDIWDQPFLLDSIKPVNPSCFNGGNMPYIQKYLVNPDISNIHNRVFYTDIKTYLPNNQLEYVDKMSMAHALEVRVPFCDHKLLEFSAAIPHHLKLKGMSTKYLLKKAVSRILPPDIINRKKLGFNLPLGLWFQGDLNDLIRDALSESNLKKRGFFNYKTVKKILDEHDSTKKDLSLHIWIMLVFQIWYDEYIN
ncbi:MAG: asparagine synthase (glutamine-hydrolyzing) [Candidatus Anammoxibacter sp.]